MEELKRININEFIWFLILGGFALYIGSLLYKGDIVNFINPRMVKYVFIGLIGISILWVYQLGRLYSPDKGEIRLGYLIFLLPLFLGFIIKPGSLNSSIVKSKGANLSSLGNMVHERPMEALTDKYLILKDGVLEIDDKNFLAAMDDLERNRKKYKEKSIVITGFVIKDNGFGKDGFAVGRIIMACCAADSEVAGFLARGEEAEALKADEWVRVTGKIDYCEYTPKHALEAKIVPVIKIKRIYKISKPENPYIYQ